MFDWRKLWQPAKTQLRQFWGIEWSTEGLVGAAVRLEGGGVVLTHPFTIPFTGERTPDRAGAEIAAELATKTTALGGHAPCVVIASREMVVVRQLQLPSVPVDELPALVSFQAAAKSSTPSSSIVVDFVPLGASGDGQGVLATMLDANRVQRIRDLITRAQLQLIGLEVTPYLIAELVAIEEEQGGTPDVPTLIVAQSGDRVEISILDQRRLIATHAVWLPEGDAVRHLSPLQTEINRCLISLGQSHPGVEVDQVVLLEDEHPDEEVVRVLTERFGEKVRPLNLRRWGASLPATQRLSYAAIVARGVTESSRIVSRVDLVNPRRPAEKPDHSKRSLIAGGAVAALLIGGTWWNFRSQMSDLDSQIETLSEEIATNRAEVTGGKATLEAAKTLSTWMEGDQDLLSMWNQIHQLLPGTDRLYFLDLKSTPTGGVKLIKFTGTARARDRDDVDDLLQRLADAGWHVKPISPIESKKDPDYPWQFIVDAELPRPVEEKSSDPKTPDETPMDPLSSNLSPLILTR